MIVTSATVIVIKGATHCSIVGQATLVCIRGLTGIHFLPRFHLHFARQTLTRCHLWSFLYNEPCAYHQSTAWPVYERACSSCCQCSGPLWWCTEHWLLHVSIRPLRQHLELQPPCHIAVICDRRQWILNVAILWMNMVTHHCHTAHQWNFCATFLKPPPSTMLNGRISVAYVWTRLFAVWDFTVSATTGFDALL